MLTPQTVTGPLVIYLPWDPAFDSEHAKFDAAKYGDTLDPAHLPILEGAKPTVFEAQRLSRKGAQRVKRMAVPGASDTDACVEALALGLKAVRNWRDGQDLELRLVKDHTLPDETRLADDALDKLYAFGGMMFLESIGRLIYRHSQPSPL